MSNIKRPSFTDRDVQYPNRVTLLPSEGSAVTYDVVPAPGTVTQEGTPVDSDLMNEMADYSELGYKNKLYVSANGHADDVFYETGEPSTVNIYGQTRQNLWKNPSGTSNGVTVMSNEDGSMTFSGTATNNFYIYSTIYSLKPGSTYTLSIDNGVRANISIQPYGSDGYISDICTIGANGLSTHTAVFPQNATYARLMIQGIAGKTLSGTYRVMLREVTAAEIAALQQTASTLQEGGTADIPQDYPVTLPAYPLAESEPFDWCPPGLTSVSELTLNVRSENLLDNSLFPINDSKDYLTAQIPLYQAPIETGEVVTITLWGKLGDGKSYFGLYNSYANAVDVIGYFYPSDEVEPGVYRKQLSWKKCATYLERGNESLLVYAMPSSVSAASTIEHMQIEKAPIAEASKEYIPYGSSKPIELQDNILASLQNGTRDVLTVDANGACSIESDTIMSVETSSDGWNYEESYKRFYKSFGADTSDLTNGVASYCDTVPLLASGGTASNVNGYTVGYEGRVYLKIIGVESLDALNMWFASNPTTFILKRQTPQTVELGSIDPVIPPSTTTNMWVSANSTLTPELDFTYDKRLSLGSNTTFGFVKGDGTTIDVINGVIQLAGDVVSGIWDKVKPYADATYALINHTHTASQLPKATTSALGLVKPDGSTLSIDGNGTLSVAGGGSGYTLPPATATTLGGIKVGDNLTVESDGTLNATGGGGSIPNPLPITQGGTGAQTAAAAEYNILGSPNASSNAIGDSDKLAVVYASPSASNGVLYTQTALKLWNYIKSKADSVYRAAAAKIPWADLEDVPASFPPSAHTHSAGNITSGTLPIARGGTGGATADAALTNLGVKGTASGNVTEHYKLGKLHFIRITGTVASLANNQTTVGPFNLGFNMPTQPSGASAVSFTQGTLLSRYTSNAKATVNTLSYTSRSSISINLFAQQAISTSVTYDVWLAVSEA